MNTAVQTVGVATEGKPLPSGIWDRPASNDELKRACDTPNAEEIDEAIGTASSQIDDGELGDIVACEFNIADLIAAGDAMALGHLVMHLRRQRIADIASRAVYGYKGAINASQVRV